MICIWVAAEGKGGLSFNEYMVSVMQDDSFLRICCTTSILENFVKKVDLMVSALITIRRKKRERKREWKERKKEGRQEGSDRDRVRDEVIVLSSFVRVLSRV